MQKCSGTLNVIMRYRHAVFVGGGEGRCSSTLRANNFDIARVMIVKDRRENAISRKIYIHEYPSERTRPLWYISSTIEGTRWIVCDEQRMRIMENRRAGCTEILPPSSNVVSKLPEIPRLVCVSRKLEESNFPLPPFLKVSPSSALIARFFFPFIRTTKFLNSCGPSNATSRKTRGRYKQGKMPG